MTNKEKTVKKPAAAPAVEKRSFWERNEASNGILLTETIKKYAISIFRGILLFGMCFMIIQPILNKISLSFMAERDLYDTTIILVPKHFSVSNWKIALSLLNYKTKHVFMPCKTATVDQGKEGGSVKSKGGDYYFDTKKRYDDMYTLRF